MNSETNSGSKDEPRLQSACDQLWDLVIAERDDEARRLIDALPAEFQTVLRRVECRARGFHKSASEGSDFQRLLPSSLEYIKPIGSGGMGRVFLCRQTSLDRLVAVKVLSGLHDARRLQLEARLTALIDCPEIVRVHDLVTLSNGQSALVMEFVDGDSLESRILASSGPLKSLTVLPWMQQCANGMRYLALSGIVHRDLKPGNLLLDREGQLKIVDFGLATWADSPVHLTADSQILGTPLYMSPEQAEDPRRANEVSDIYSFGATFYHALVGRPPFRGQSMIDIVVKHRTEPLTAPDYFNPSLNPQLCRVVERCLAKDPRDRWSSFEELHDVLGRIDSHDTDEEFSSRVRPWATRAGDLLGRSERGELDEIHCGPGRIIRIVQDDICTQDVDAIVSSDDNFLTMGGGVSYAIAEAAGPEMSRQVQHYTPVLPGRVVVTSGEKLPARFVLHAVTLRLTEVNGTLQIDSTFQPTAELIRDLLRSCLYHAETHSIQTIALPLLGTGTGGLSPETCLETMIDSLYQSLASERHPLREARIVLRPQQDVSH